MPLPSDNSALTPISRFSTLPTTPPDPILHLASLARSDLASTKLDLSLGTFTTVSTNNKIIAYTPPSVIASCRRTVEEPHPYLPIEGYQPLAKAAAGLIFGNTICNGIDKAVTSVTTVGGSGALRVALELWRKSTRYLDLSNVGRIWVAQPTWPGHWGIPQGAGWKRDEIRTYECSSVSKELEKNGRAGDLVILQGGAQNPTGRVLGRKEWERLLRVIKRESFGLVWDVAYQGWGGGGIDGDVWAVRRSIELDIECFVCQSFSKSMGLYGERVGALHVISNDTGAEENVRSLLKKLIRDMYSSPPAFGAKVAATVLNDKELRIQWERELAIMVEKVDRMRRILIESLEEKFEDSHKWSFLSKQRGMFAYLNLSKQEVDYLRHRFHIYVAEGGRLSLGSLPEDKVAYLVDALFSTIRGKAAKKRLEFPVVAAYCNYLGWNSSMPALPARLLHFCVVGSGPSGFYAVSTLLKRFPSCHVDLLERLPVPFGLLRYGVAPDHPEARAVVSRFGKLMSESPRARYFGNIEVGEKGGVDINTLQAMYSGVVLAVGCSRDKKLGIPGEETRGVQSAGNFVKWYNGHPEFEGKRFGLADVEQVVVVGNGNVALDVARILLRNPDSLTKTDMPEYALQELRKSRINSVTIVGRRGLAQAAWTAKELRECLSGLDGSFAVRVAKSEIEIYPEDSIELKSKRSNRRCADLVSRHASRLSTENSQIQEQKYLSLRFLLSPTKFLSTGGNKLRGVRLAKNRLVGKAGSRIAEQVEPHILTTLPCQLALRSIGYRGEDLVSVLTKDRRGRYANDRGRIKSGLYCTGWCKRGPQGVIGSNLWDAEETVDSIAQDVERGSLNDVKLVDTSVFGNYVDWNGWLRVDEEERRRGTMLNKEREKVIMVDEMIEFANVSGPRSAAGTQGNSQ